MDQGIQNKSQGSIIVFVLGMIVLLSALIVGFIQELEPHILINTVKQSEEDLKRVAYSSLETTLGVMAQYKEVDGALYAPSQGWGNPLQFAEVNFDGFEVTIEFEDETGKLPINGLTEETYIKMFENLGVDSYAGAELVDKLMDWTDEDDLARLNGAESDYYLDAIIPYVPANQPLHSLEELRMVAGFDELFFDIYGNPNEFFYVLESMFSAVNSKNVNINSASPALFSFQGDVSMDQEALWDYLNGDDGESGTSDDRYFATLEEVPEAFRAMLPGVTLTNEIEWLRIRITVRQGLSEFTLDALISVSSGEYEGPDRSFNRFKREEQIFTALRDREEENEMGETGNLSYPFTVFEIRENDYSL